MRYFDFILNEGYPEAQREFAAASGDPNLASEVIGQYRTLVNRNQVQGNERNIDWWRKQGWQSFSQFVTQKLQQPSKTQIKRQKVAGRSITLMESDQWLVVVPLDKEASCFHGKDSDWCTTKPFQPYFENYFYDREVTLIYCLNKQTGGMWAIAAHKKLVDKWEIFDQEDRSISDATFFSQTQLNVKRIVDLALSDVHQPEVQKSRTGYKDSVETTRRLLQQWIDTPPKDRQPRIPEIEQQLLFNKNQELSFMYLKHLAITAMAYTQANRRNSPPGSRYGLYTIDATKFPEEIAIAGILSDARAYKYFTNPTERMAMAAIQEDPTNITLIDNPSVKVQMAAAERDIMSVQYLPNIAPEVLEKFPELKNTLVAMPDQEFDKFLPRIYELIQEAMDETIWDMEATDDYYRDWQAEQAREMGLLLFPDGTPYEGDPADLENELEERELDMSDMEVDWDRVHGVDDLNDYYDYNPDVKYFANTVYDDVLKVMTPENIKQWTREYIDEMGSEIDSPLGPESLDAILGWKIKEEVGRDNDYGLGDLVKENLIVRKDQAGNYIVKWARR